MQETRLKHKTLCSHPWGKDSHQDPTDSAQVFNWPRISTASQEVSLEEILSSQDVDSLKMPEACPKSQGWHILSIACALFCPHL